MRRASKPQARSVRAKEAILGAARTTFATEGFDGASVDSIAAACDRTKGAVYHHFESKDHLFEQVFILEQRRIADVAVRAASAGDPVASLQAGVTAYLDLIATDADAARLTLVDAPGALGWEHWRRCDDGPFRSLLSASIEAIRDAGRLRDGYDPVVLTELLLGAITEAGLAIASAEDAGTVGPYGSSIVQLVSHITLP